MKDGAFAAKARGGQRSGRRRTWLAWGAAGLGAVTAVLVALPVASGRTSPPVYSRLAAERAVAEARNAGAARWSPHALAESERSLRASQAAARRQELRFLPLRNYGPVREAFRDTERAAGRALDEARAARETCREAARAALDKADRAVDSAQTLTASLRVDGTERAVFRRAKIHLAEARLLWKQEDFESARVRAEDALDEAERVLEVMTSEAARYLDAGHLRRWRQWRDETIAWSRRRQAPAIVVNKDRSLLTLYDAGRVVRTYPVDLGSNPLRDKKAAGDSATPEGRYHVTAKKDRGRSRYHKALELDYPNAEDRRRFAESKRAGRVPAGASPGGLIEIHGEGGRGQDWTRGCIALSNEHIDDLFRRVMVGTPVTIIGGEGEHGRFSRLVLDGQSEDDHAKSGE